MKGSRTDRPRRARPGRGRVVVAAFVVATLAAALWPNAAEAQCAMCRTALNSPEGRALIAAFQRGILLLLAVPFALIVGIAALAIRSQRRLLSDGHVESEPSPAVTAAPQPGGASSRRAPAEGPAGALGADAVR